MSGRCCSSRSALVAVSQIKMTNGDRFVKMRALAVVGILAFFFPPLLLAALICKVYEAFRGNTKRKSVAGDVAVVTGAAHGLGRAIAIELAKTGCHVAAVDINLHGAEETAAFIVKNYEVKAKAYKVDISNYEAVVELNKQITADLGAATILVNNAGVLLFSNMAEPDAHEVERMINVNLTAHFWTNRVFLANMKAFRRGHIIAISSIAGLIPLAFNGEYTSTKFAVRGLMRALRQELKLKYKNIGTTTVFPAFLTTNDEVKKITEATAIDRYYPLISGEEAARRIIRGMLQNKEEIIMPGFFALVHRLQDVLPAAWQDAIAVGIFGAIIDKFEWVQQQKIKN